MQGSEYVLHIDFEEIKAEIERLQEADKKLADAINSFMESLKRTTARIEPTLKKETDDERVLWQDYRQLQREKLTVLDLSHEWDYISQTIKGINPKLDFLVKDAIEELNEHLSVVAESHRAHIDILEIYNTRKIEVLALVITVIISYLAVCGVLRPRPAGNHFFPIQFEPRHKLPSCHTDFIACFRDHRLGLAKTQKLLLEKGKR